MNRCAEFIGTIALEGAAPGTRALACHDSQEMVGIMPPAAMDPFDHADDSRDPAEPDNQLQKDQFLYPIRITSNDNVSLQQLAFSANLQEFSQRVSLLCALTSNGKLTPLEAYDQIHILWTQLAQTKDSLAVEASPFLRNSSPDQDVDISSGGGIQGTKASPDLAPLPPHRDGPARVLDSVTSPALSSFSPTAVYFSVIIPTYNRRPILEKCLRALAHQYPGDYEGYEVIVVDDGSTDGTIEWLNSPPSDMPPLRLCTQSHQGPATARNLGVRQAKGSVIIFIDSDLVVVEAFLAAHARTLRNYGVTGDPNSAQEAKVFPYGRGINTANYEDPPSEPFKPTDFSAAFFATGNVAIARRWLDEAAESVEGPFDSRFNQYGWEDLELGVRLKKRGLKLVKCPAAAGYHWHPPFSLDQIPRLIDRELQRGRMGVLFYQKHPTWEVRLMIQMTPLHTALWGTLSLWGFLNERRVQPLLRWLVKQNRPQLALELCRILFLNWYNVQGVYAAYREQGLK